MFLKFLDWAVPQCLIKFLDWAVPQCLWTGFWGRFRTGPFLVSCLVWAPLPHPGPLRRVGALGDHLFDLVGGVGGETNHVSS